jgi:DNA-binding NtrC family response regulator
VTEAAEPLEVLLVDDELATLHLLEQFCRTRNLAVTTASDGQAAIDLLEEDRSRFTIVLADINTPRASGFDVLRAARNGNRYVVMITGYATLDSAVRAVREGAYDYLAKPFSLGQLDMMLARIRQLLALEREVRDLRSRLAAAPGGAAAASSVAASAPGEGPRTVTLAAPMRPLAAVPVFEVTSRVDTMEDRLGKIEDILRTVLTVPAVSH